MSIATASQAWAILARHARDDIQSLRLQELCQDNHRVSSLVTVHDDLIVDISRQHMTLETLQHLLHLANARGCIEFMQDMPYSTSSLHLALRAPRGSVMLLTSPLMLSSMEHHQSNTHNMHGNNSIHSGSNNNNNNNINHHHHHHHHPHHDNDMKPNSNACHMIHSEWDRIHLVSDSIRRGLWRGVTGSVLRDVVVVGSGVPMQALKMIYHALLHDSAGAHAAVDGLAELLTRRTFTTVSIPVGHRQLRFVSSIDAKATQTAIADLDAGSTLVISLALTGREETGLASRLCKNWLVQELSPRKVDMIFSKHMLLVTGNDRLFNASKPESVFQVPLFCRSEPFCTLSTMTLLPLSIIFGWNLIHDGLLAGAHSMDSHMVETNPRHNIPLLLALVDLWNDAFLNQPGRLLQPFEESFDEYAIYVAALESQVCASPSHPAFGNSTCGMVVTGNMYDRCQYHASRIMPTELIMSLDPAVRRDSVLSRQDILHHHDALLCSMLGHADELASVSTNRPSTLLLCGKMNAFMCGQLIALAEHRAILKAKLWNMTLAIPHHVDVPLRTIHADKLREELSRILENGDMNETEGGGGGGGNLSTSTLLSNYAGRTRELRKTESM